MNDSDQGEELGDFLNSVNEESHVRSRLDRNANAVGRSRLLRRVLAIVFLVALAAGFGLQAYEAPRVYWFPCFGVAFAAIIAYQFAGGVTARSAGLLSKAERERLRG